MRNHQGRLARERPPVADVAEPLRPEPTARTQGRKWPDEERGDGSLGVTARGPDIGVTLGNAGCRREPKCWPENPRGCWHGKRLRVARIMQTKYTGRREISSPGPDTR